MGEKVLKATEQGRESIQQARSQKGWTIRVEDLRPLKAASKFLLQQHQENSQWHKNDPLWLKDLDQLVRVEKPQTLNSVRQQLVKSQQGSLLERILDLIDAGEVLAKGISYGSWNRFAGKTGTAGAKVFKAYCYVLGLEWQAIVADCGISTSSPAILHNLPLRDHTAFFDRQTELTFLLERLSFESLVHRIGLVGMGGVGKTSLMLEAAYHCLAAQAPGSQVAGMPSFEAIIFASAKSSRLIPAGILPCSLRDRTLGDIFRAIAHTLQRPDLLRAEFQTQWRQIRQALGAQHTLLLLDNLETVEDLEDVRSFLYDLPPTVKVVTTSRVRELLDVVISLEPLPKTDSLQLIQHHLQEKQVSLAQEVWHSIHQKTDGIPIAIAYTVGQLAFGYPPELVLTHSIKAMENLPKFCFEDSVAPLRGQSSHQLLMVMALFSKSAAKAAIAQIADVTSPVEVAEGFAQLHQLSLIQLTSDRCSMLPLTRSYCLAELEANPEFGSSARERWIAWSLRFCREHGSEDWQEWNPYDPLEQEWENLRDVVEYCIAHDRYNDFQQLWQFLKGYTHTYGYWNERRMWMEWLIAAATQRQDGTVLTQALFDKARTLTLFDQPEHREAAIACCQQVLELVQIHQPDLQFDAQIHLVLLQIQQQQFDSAIATLNQATALLQQSGATETTHPRQWIQTLYYQAQICLETGAYTQAKDLYTQALGQAELIHWQRSITYIQDWLAQVAIKQQNWAEAEQLVTTSLQAAEQNHDQRCMAHCQRSLALLEKERGHRPQSQAWAAKAEASFKLLGMFQEAEAMKNLLTQE